MTPDEFAERMQTLIDDYKDDVNFPPCVHRKADGLLLACLFTSGYAKGVKLYINMSEGEDHGYKEGFYYD